MEGNRLAVFIDPPLGFPTYELEEARYHLENRLSYEREVCSPEETQHLLKDVRGRLTHKGQRNLEQALWGVVESINFIHSQSLRAGMIQAVRKLDRPALVASRPVRDAICLHDIFINPPQDFTQEDYETLTRERQQNEDILILSVQELWSIVTKPVDAAVPYELDVKKFRSFMLHVLALLQYFPARPLTAQKEKDVDYYSLTVLDYES
ncbi:hypothetical protein LTR46_011997 [Exophiala xenobiotica]|nr:hypothetical protein LTR46_011997 [Exophiala xenobiotica]